MGMIIKNPEHSCRLGKGTDCCAYLANHGQWICGRTIDGISQVIEARLLIGTMKAKGTGLWDTCEYKKEVIR